MSGKRAAGTRGECSFVSGRLELKAAADGSEDGVFSGHGALFGVPHPTSAWQLPADWNDVFAPGAFKRTLAEHKARGTLPAMVLQHDIMAPIGAYRSMAEDKEGLALEGQLALKTDDGAETYELMKIGALRGLSVGFRAVKASFDEKKKVRELVDVDLFEVSPVTIGAIPGALISDVKAMSDSESSQLSLGVQGLMAMCEDMSEGCEDCAAGSCEHKDLIGKCQDMLDSLKPGEGKSLRIDPHNIRDLEALLRDAGMPRSEAKRLLAGGFKALGAERDAGGDGLMEGLRKLQQTISGA